MSFNLGFITYNGVAAATYGIIIGGTNGTRFSSSVKYNLGDGTQAAGGSLGTANESPAPGASSATTGYIPQGFDGAYANTVSKYNFSTDGVSAGTALAYAMVNSSSAGNSTKMVVGAGNRGGGGGEFVVARVEVYTYSGDTKVDGTNLNQTSDARGACGNATIGIWLGGSPDPSNGSKYTYSSDAVATVSNYVGTNRFRPATAATTTKGYYFSGTNGTVQTVVDVWTFAADTRVAGTSISTGRDSPFGCSNSTLSIIAGGNTGSYTTSVETYTFSSDTVGSSTALGTARGYGSALSTNPGWF